MSKPTDEPPPLLGSWRRVYVAVLLNTAFIILILYIFSRWAGGR